MPPENGDNGNGNGEEITEVIAGEIADVVEDEISETDVEIDVETTVIEAPVIPETASVDVGDLHISGPPALVESVTQKYLKDHIDHNPHPVDVVDDAAAGITPEPVEELIRDTAAGETVDVPPGPSDWLFRERGGQ